MMWYHWQDAEAQAITAMAETHRANSSKGSTNSSANLTVSSDNIPDFQGI